MAIAEREPRRRWPVLALLVGMQVGLAGPQLACHLAMGPAEHGAYRRYESATTEEARIVAARAYLDRYPDGSQSASLRSWLETVRERRLSWSWHRIERLRRHLELFPDGPAAPAVRARLVRLTRQARAAAARSKREDALAVAIERKLDAAARDRRRLVREFSALVRAVAAVRDFDRRADIVAALPAPDRPTDCDALSCRCERAVRYHVPGHRRLIAREAPLVTTVELVGDDVTSIEVRGRELFTRLGEAVERRVVPRRSLIGRAEAVGRVGGLLENLLDDVLPSKRCHVDAVTPVLLRRRCDGVELTVHVGRRPGDPDRIVLVPVDPAGDSHREATPTVVSTPP